VRILVTGSAGFVGSWIAQALIENGHKVLGIDDFSGGENSACDQLTLDLRNRRDLDIPIQFFKPEVLVHLAANAREGASQFQPWEVVSRNVSAYASVLEASLQAGVSRVVLFSSMAVYGDQTPPFDETLPLKPVDVYGTCKASMERMTEILSLVHGFQWVVLRPHNVFGERQSMTDRYRNVVAIFMNRILRGEPIYIYGDGSQERAFSYIKNSLPCYVRAIEDTGVNKEAINIGGRVPITVKKLAELVMEQMGIEAKIIYLPDRPLEVKYAYATTEKSERLLNYVEQYSLESGIASMASWAKKAGLREWKSEPLALVNELTPKTWVE